MNINRHLLRGIAGAFALATATHTAAAADNNTYRTTASPATETARRTHKVYLVGAGISSLSSAVYCINDGHILGTNIYIFEQSSALGGCLDAAGTPDTGYSLRGERMFSEGYTAMSNFLSQLPSLTYPGLTLNDEYVAFNAVVKTDAKARLIDTNRSIVDLSMLISKQDLTTMSVLMDLPESVIGDRRIEDFFSNDFFQSNYWYLWSSSFAFQPWHSAVEFKRYLYRFMDCVPHLRDLGSALRSQYNQYDSFVLPTVRWLQQNGVHFVMNRKVVDLGFTASGIPGNRRVNQVYCVDNAASTNPLPGSVAVGEGDYVFVTLGSMVESSAIGDNDHPAKLLGKKDGGAWTLWETLAKKATHHEFGSPQVFDDRIAQSKWVSYTVTIRDTNKAFLKAFEAKTGNVPGESGINTFKGSAWSMSIVLPHQPFLVNQPDDVVVFWGDGLTANKKGDYVNKTLEEATGKDILAEIVGHLGIDPQTVTNAIVRPAMMPFITSQFLTRSLGDRPQVVPSGVTNLGLMGQFVEIPFDTVFTVDYSIRSAQMATYTLFKLQKLANPVPAYWLDPAIAQEAMQELSNSAY
jgi:oleate hydratase